LTTYTSDTTSLTFSAIFLYLAKHQNEQQKLHEELDPLFLSGLSEEQVLKDLGFAGAKRAPHLEGVIREALRINPAVPSGLDRITPPEGVTIDGTFIPGDTHVRIPKYCISRGIDPTILH
jgi:tryprostatin B 6-hydroxylase